MRKIIFLLAAIAIPTTGICQSPAVNRNTHFALVWTNSVLQRAVISVDNSKFVNDTFVDSTIVSTGAPTTLIGNHFIRCVFVATGNIGAALAIFRKLGVPLSDIRIQTGPRTHSNSVTNL